MNYKFSNLDNIIDKYVPFDKIEKEHKKEFIAWLKSPMATLDYRYMNPGHATASAFVKNISTNNILLIYHPNLLKWLQPGGHAEENEQDLIDIAIREVFEETNLCLDKKVGFLFDLDVHRIKKSKFFPSHLHFDIRFYFETEDESITPSNEINTCKWFSITEANTLNLNNGLQRMINKSIKNSI